MVDAKKPLGPSLALASYKANPPARSHPASTGEFFSVSSLLQMKFDEPSTGDFFSTCIKKMHACITRKPLASHCKPHAGCQPLHASRSPAAARQPHAFRPHVSCVPTVLASRTQAAHKPAVSRSQATYPSGNTFQIGRPN